jgi:MarR family 2-MHQ and catechol resistance regulon transcriptional repressor
MKLYEELGLRKDFAVLAHEVVLNIFYTATRLKKKAQEFFLDAGITDVQFNVLMLLFHNSDDTGGMTQAELSRMLLVNPANITSMCDRMEKADLIERSSRSGDRRLKIIKLTAHGRSLVQNLEEAYMKEVRTIMSILSDNELNTLLHSLEKIRADLNGCKEDAV